MVLMQLGLSSLQLVLLLIVGAVLHAQASVNTVARFLCILRLKEFTLLLKAEPELCRWIFRDLTGRFLGTWSLQGVKPIKVCVKVLLTACFPFSFSVSFWFFAVVSCFAQLVVVVCT